MDSGDRRGTICIAYLSGFAPSWSERLIAGVAACLPSAVSRLPVSLDLAPAYARERHQYHATLLLAALLRHRPPTAAKIVGITNVDLFIPVLTFVFGQAQLNGPGAIVSTHRLRTEFYGLPADETVLVERTIKETVHELGHAYGLVHCRDYRCVMHASTAVEQVDLKDQRFCGDCQGELGWIR